MRSHCAAHRRYLRGCAGCQVNARDYRRARLAGLADGTWEQYDASPELLERGRQHLRGLLAVKGVTTRRIAAVAGVSLNAVQRTASGSTRYKVAAVSVEATLGVTAQACLALIDRSTIPVDPTGTARRLQALARDGWSPEAIGELLGRDCRTVRAHRLAEFDEITLGTRERYRELYDKIQSQADPRGDSDRARQHAERSGWPGPERWLDGEIDDPDAEPLPPPPDTDDWVEVSRMIDGALRDPQPGKAREYPRHIKREIARQATTRLGWSYARTAELLGLGGPDGSGGTSAVEYLLYGRKDRPRTKELWKDGK